MSEVPAALVAALHEAQRRGAVGPEPIGSQVERSLEFLRREFLPADASCLDLGSGGGLPGLPLVWRHPGTHWVLVDAREQRADDLRRAVRNLGYEDRVRVVHGRAEELGRGPLRGSADVVVARGFGPPALTSEYGAPFVAEGGRLVVSTRRGGEGWPPGDIPLLGLVLADAWDSPWGSFRTFVRRGALDERYPRRPSVQSRHPLF